MSNIPCIKRGSGSVDESLKKITKLTYAASIDIKLVSPKYASFTVNNFIVGVKGFTYNEWNGSLQPKGESGTAAVTYSYNATTGILTIVTPGVDLHMYNDGVHANLRMYTGFVYLME